MDDAEVVSVRVHVTITGRNDVQVLNESYGSQHQALWGIATLFDMDTAMLDTPVQEGDRLRGFCGGMFGRDAFLNKIVEGIGPDWCVAREDDGRVVAATGEDGKMPFRLIEYRMSEEQEFDDDD